MVDGSNLATEGRTFPSLAQLDEAVRTYAEEDPGGQITVVVDASFEHRIDESERDALRDAMLNGEVVSPPAGAIGRGDAFVLRIAERTGAVVVSNDSFQEFHGEHPWLFDDGRLVGGKPVPGVGWIFTPRLPIRGPKSRAATAEKRSKKDPISAPAKAAELAKAAKKAAKRAPAKKVSASWPLVPAAPPPKSRKAADPALSSAINDAVAEALEPTPVKRGSTKKAAATKATKKKIAPAKAEASKKAATKKATGKKASSKAAPTKKAVATKVKEPATEPKQTKKNSASPLPAVNEPLAFINFVAAFSVGSTVEGEVVSFTSHGAMVDVPLPEGGALHCYIPLSAMGTPPPTKAREVLTKGVTRSFVLSGLDPPRRVAELMVPPAPTKKRGAAKKAAKSTAAR